MTLKKLQAILKLWENGCDFNIHKQLGISLATLQSYITEFEREAGFTFLRYDEEKTYLTEEGYHFLPYLQNITALFKQGLAETFAASKKELAGEIVIATTPLVASCCLLESLRIFRLRYPQVLFRIIADDYISAKTERLVDIVLRPIARSDFFIKKDFLIQQWAIPYQMSLWASPDYLHKKGVPQHPKDLLQHSILGYGEHTFSYFSHMNWHLKGEWGGLPPLTPSLSLNSHKFLVYAAQ